MANKKRNLIDQDLLIDSLGISDAEIFAKEVICDAPTVDAVEVVHGRWIDRPNMKGQVYCSECATLEKSTDSNYKSRHCPNCGAKMDGDGNGI